MKAGSSEPKIEKNIPIPPSTGKRDWTVLKKLGVGESVELAAPPVRASNAAQHHIGIGKYVVRKTDNGCRIWRTA